MAGKAGFLKIIRTYGVPVTLFCIAGFFFRSAGQGSRGLAEQVTLRKDLAAARADESKAAGLEKLWLIRVSGLQSAHIDLDLLDQQARAVLSYASPGDYMIVLPPLSVAQTEALATGKIPGLNYPS